MAGPDRCKILVVDGDDQALAPLRRLLQNDYDVTATLHWEHGLDLLNRNEFAAVIAGDRLAWLGGVEFLERACEAQPSTCRILVGSGSKGDALASAINNARIHAYVTRPCQGAALKQIIAHEIQLASEQRRLVREHRHYKRLLVDGAAGLPCRALVMDQAESRLRGDGALGVLCVDASKLWAQELHLTRRDFEQAKVSCLEMMGKLAGSQVRRDELVAADEVGGPRFFVFLAPPREGRSSAADDIRRAAERLAHTMAAHLAKTCVGHLAQPAVSVGTGYCLYDPRLDVKFQAQQLVEMARASALAPEHHRDMPDRLADLQGILTERRVRSLFQPIVSLTDLQVLGYEALSRGPLGSAYESPEFLMSMADEAGLAVEFDRLLRTQALTHAVELPKRSLIFMNTQVSTTHDPEFSAERLGRLLKQLDIHPSRVVLEISERSNITNHALLAESLRHYRALGVQLAIDDVGAGYSGLERIVALHPNYLKIDRTLVQDIHTLPVKRAVLGAMAALAASLGAEVIAEGIEQQDEVDCLLELGIRYGQGFLLGRPGHARPRAFSSFSGAWARA